MPQGGASDPDIPMLFCKVTICAHGVGRVVGALGSEAGFAGSMLN